VTTNIRDPRSIVTPDAFEVSGEMLGLPLASPRRRLAGMLVDLVVVGLLTASVSGWGFFIWGVIGLGVLQFAFREPGGSWAQGQLGRATAWVFRGSAGCLGLFILFMVGLVWLGARSDFDEARLEERIRQLSESGVTVEGQGEEAVRVEGLADLQELANVLSGVPPSDVELVLDSALAAEVGVLDPAALVAALAATEAPDAPDSLFVADAAVPREIWRDALRARAIDLFAADTVATLERTATRQADRLDALRADLEAAEEEADSGFFALARDILEQLGSAFGVWTLYFTVATVVTRGRTVGKLLARTRVVRLDGEPLTWLLSLERAGGYAAGLATGLMGFMRVFWDRNRQCVHDRIAGTVVVREGVAAVPGSWEEVWSNSEEGKG